MTTKNKDSLIGYDPLAWMNEESESSPDDTPTEASESATAEVSTSPDVSLQEANAETKNEEIIAESSMPESQPDPVVNDVSSDSSKISLDATLNIQTVVHMQELLINALHANEQIEIDASAVHSVDTASMQLLVVLKQEAIKSNKEVIFDFPSDRFIEAAQLLGIAEMLAVDQAAAGFF
ncbi:MAG: STAS domain-containing protein [Methyloprofundus sp.]|nr:STAS domain-containing protein [Methyloprofundus sp.]